LDVGPNSGGSALLIPLRFFQLSEATRDPMQKFDEFAWDTALGLRGNFGAGFDWELAYHRSDYKVERDNRLLLDQPTNAFFFGPQLGSLPFGTAQLPIVSVTDYSRFVRPLTPAEFRSITALNHTEADSSNDQVSAVISGDLFKLPAGAVQFASVFEWGTQEYDINLDPREVAGEFAGFLNSFPGGGSRDRYAAGVELAVPVLSSVRTTLAGRYDKYDDITNVDDAFTYNLGLEYRPFKTLLLRGSYATSFRAPDMHFVFAGSSSTFSAPRDALRCRRDFGVTDLNQCAFIPGLTGVLATTERQGNPGLKEETSKSWTAGLAWNITQSLDFTVDYFDIQIENTVNDLTDDFITGTEADCVLGRTLSGAPVDSSSAQCQFIRGLVTRNVPVPGVPGSIDNIAQLNTLPINRAFEGVTGLDASLNYFLDANRWGRFFFTFGWSHILKQERQEFAGDPVDSYRDDSRNRDLRSKIRSSVTWEKSGFSQTLYVDRQGSRPTYAAAFTANPTEFRTRPYSFYNYTVSYTSPADTWSVGLIVDNLLDADPKIDGTFAGWPFFFGQNVNAYGREVFLEGKYKFK
ncbi:MAG: TonB-dependent receptor domain-containing protein, partial [Steroidobacteraceae bacterium]